MTNTPFPLGRIAAPDERDHRFLMAVVLTDEEPFVSSISYRRGPILDQGATSSCVGHGWRAWLNGAPVRQTRGPDAFDIYHAAQENDEWEGTDYQGTSVRGGAKALAALGYIASYVWAFDELTVKRWLLTKRGGVVIGVNWYSEMFRPDAAGVLSLSGSLVGGHCVWVRGYNQPRDAYRIQNSWGSGWGQGGQAWLRAVDLSRLLVEGGEACCGAEVRRR
jgi:hypothetical protein